ncbi:MAG: SMP-30/gluconolactonase/LRE family protein [Acidobacteria bacterium]|nr:SMP-30/gluconolactonase/LRE family protein [Acidobacteriota bacterium]
MRTAAFFGVLALGTLFVVRSVPGGRTAEQTGPRIVRTDKALDTLIARDAQVEQIAAGFGSAAGPVWNRAGRFLLFSDTPNNAVFRWREGEGASLYARLFAGAAPRPAALAMDDDGRVVLCERGTGRLTRLELDGTQTTLAGMFEDLQHLVYRRDGSLFFTDSASGVYRLSGKGAVRLVTNAVDSPRGIAFSPDERTLYVSSSGMARARWYAFDIDAEGRVKRQRVFFDAAMPGTADGMQVDKHGNVFAAGPGGVHVVSAQGRQLGSIVFDQSVSDCAWGGDGSILYVTAGTAVYRVRTLTRGH